MSPRRFRVVSYLICSETLSVFNPFLHCQPEEDQSDDFQYRSSNKLIVNPLQFLGKNLTRYWGCNSQVQNPEKPRKEHTQ